MNSDDFGDDDFDVDDPSFDDFDEGSGDKTLGSVIKNSPAAKIGIVVLAIAVVFGVVIIMGGGDDDVGVSRVGSGSSVSAPPGTEAASPEYIEAIQEVNEREAEIAERTGGSALPTPIEPPVGVLTVPEQAEEREDPLQRWRRLQEERLERELQQAQTVEPSETIDNTARDEAIRELAQAMSSQMEAILDSQQDEVQYRSILTPDVFESSIASASETTAAEGEDGLFSDLEEEVIQEILVPAGEIAYAQLLTEANTDAPGPILAEIMSGPLKGSRLIGSFEETRNYLTLNFATAVVDGVGIEISAVAIDPETTLPGFATEIDRHYLKRILLPAAAAFITGFSNAIAESGTTTVTVSGDTVVEEEDELSNDQEVATGVAEAGAAIGEIINEEVSDIEPMIRVAPGTAMGILFVEPVTTQDETL